MQDYHYNFEKRNLLSHFSAAFNDILIRRFNGKKFEKETIKVPLVYAPKTHILADIMGLTDTVRLPIMAVEIAGESRDGARVKNRMEDLIYRKENGSMVALRAVPWNISLEMTILAKYQEDMDQIVQNFSVHINPYAIISWQEPKSGREIRTEIIQEGDISLKYPGNNQTAKDAPFRITATVKFTVKGYLFKTNVENPKPICMVNTDYNITNSFFCDYASMTAHVVDADKETYIIRGRPILRYAAPYYIREGTSPGITIKGLWMPDVHAVYVSGNNPELYALEKQTPFEGVASFQGFPVDDFQRTDNSISFTLPPTSAIGFIDVVAVNSCGYGILTRDSGLSGIPALSSNHFSYCSEGLD